MQPPEKKPEKKKETIGETIDRFQDSFPGVEKKRFNTFTNSYYASLDDVWHVAKPHLRKVGLTVLSWISDGKLYVSLMNRSGEHLDSDVILPDSRESPQKFGSALTYYRRYTVCTMLNIVETGDDDGNALEQPGDPKIEDKQLSNILDLIESTETNREDVLRYIEDMYGKKSLETLSYSQASVILKLLKDKARKLND